MVTKRNLLLILFIGFFNIKSADINEPVSKKERNVRILLMGTCVVLSATYILGQNANDCIHTNKKWNYCVFEGNGFRSLHILSKIFSANLLAVGTVAVGAFTMCFKRKKRDKEPVLPFYEQKKNC